MRYRLRDVIEASPWNTHGDHAEIAPCSGRFRAWLACDCGNDESAHGAILRGDVVAHVVCPGDYIVTEFCDGERRQPYPIDPQLFHSRFELHEDEKAGPHVRQTLLAELCGEAVEALVWCGGSAEFQPDGYARLGWERGPQKVLDTWKRLQGAGRK